MCKYGVFPGPYIPAFRLNTEIFHKSPYSVRMREKTDQKQIRIWTLFTQWIYSFKFTESNDQIIEK